MYACTSPPPQQNNLTEAINFSPGGGLVSLADDPTAGDSVAPGQTYTYEFLVPDQVGAGAAHAWGLTCCLFLWRRAL